MLWDAQIWMLFCVHYTFSFRFIVFLFPLTIAVWQNVFCFYFLAFVFLFLGCFFLAIYIWARIHTKSVARFNLHRAKLTYRKGVNLQCSLCSVNRYQHVPKHNNVVCTHFSIQNIEHTRNNTMKRDAALNKWSNMMMFFDVLITVCFKSQSHRKYNGCTKSLFFCTNQKKTCTKKKTFSQQNTKDNAPKWSHKIKHTLFMRNSSKFIYIVFSVSAMCCKMSLHGKHGRAAKSPCKYAVFLKRIPICCGDLCSKFKFRNFKIQIYTCK